jgi:hypothetical protein
MWAFGERGQATGTRTQHSLHNGNQDSARPARASVGRTPPTRATLQSWKEIASELNRGVRTVQRWERKLGLPVRRVGTGSRCPVFAFKDELDGWLRSNTEVSGDDEQDNGHPQGAGDPKAEGLLQTVNDFFTLERSEKDCAQCHSRVQYLEADFWIYGTSRKWRLSIPFCPLCDEHRLEPFRRSQNIQ